MVSCTQPGCTGQILDGYCDVCGMAAAAAPVTPSTALPAAATGAGADPLSMRTPSGRVTSSRLGSVPLGSQRTTSGSRRTQRLGARRTGSTSLGAGMVSVPPVPTWTRPPR